MSGLTDDVETEKIIIRQGATWARRFVFTNKKTKTPIDLTGVNFRGHGRRNALDTGDYLFTYTFTIVNAATGTVDVELSASATVGVPVGESKEDDLSKGFWQWDVIWANGHIKRWRQGEFVMDRNLNHG